MRCGRAAFLARAGRLAAMPSLCAWQWDFQGQAGQLGDFGVQMVAPRSNKAWAKSPGAACAALSWIKAWAAAAISGLPAGSGVVMAKIRDATRSIFPSTGSTGSLKAMAPMALAV